MKIAIVLAGLSILVGLSGVALSLDRIANELSNLTIKEDEEDSEIL